MIQTLNDLAWLRFLGIACTAVLQGVVIGVLILRDPRPDPLFPRWGGYFNIWVCAMFCPAGCVNRPCRNDVMGLPRRFGETPFPVAKMPSPGAA